MKKIVVVIILVMVWIMTLFIEHITEDFTEFKAIPYRLKKDENFLKEALQVNGMVLKYLDKKYRANREWVLMAVKQNGMSLEYVDNTLKSDEELF
jgi:ATP-dependent DNA ligase